MLDSRLIMGCIRDKRYNVIKITLIDGTKITPVPITLTGIGYKLKIEVPKGKKRNAKD